MWRGAETGRRVGHEHMWLCKLPFVIKRAQGRV